MKPDIVESKTDLRVYLLSLLVVLGFLLSNLFQVNSYLYKYCDRIFLPFVIAIRHGVVRVNSFFSSVRSLPLLAEENINLKKELLRYEQVLAENEKLKDQINSLQRDANILPAVGPSLVSVEIFGVQNLNSVDSRLRIFLPESLSVNKGDVVYFDRLTLLGFVTEVGGNSAIVVPFYSSKIGFNVPVQSIKDKNIKGFVSLDDKGRILIANIPKNANLSVGDMWLTSNEVPEVPPGLIVGKVKNIFDDNDAGFKYAELSLVFDLNDTFHVFVAGE